MRRADSATVKNLIAYEGDPVMTLYVPAHRAASPPHIQEDQTRFKNLVREGCEKWREQVDDSVVTPIQEQLEALLDDLSFWQSSIETIAVYASKDGFEIYHLPIEVEERTCVGNKYDITPLLLVESMNKPCYVLALAMHESKLFKTDLYGIEEVEIDFPKSVEEALNIDEMFSNSNTMRSGRTSGANSIAASPHGQGDSSGAGTEERFMYLRIIDEKIRKLKTFDDRLPVVIAATDTEFGDFRATSQLKTIVDVHIPGNHTATALPELHRKVQLLLREHILDQQLSEMIEQVEQLKGVDRASVDAKDISSAAHEGRVETLLVPMIDMTTDSVRDGSDPEPLIRYDDEYDASLSTIITDVVANGGSVVAIERGSLPTLRPLAAIYRYAFSQNPA